MIHFPDLATSGQEDAAVKRLVSDLERARPLGSEGHRLESSALRLQKTIWPLLFFFPFSLAFLYYETSLTALQPF